MTDTDKTLAYLALAIFAEQLRKRAAHELGNDQLEPPPPSEDEPEGSGRVDSEPALNLAGALSRGSIISTRRDLDVVILGPGFLVIQAPDGDQAYSRAGNLAINSAGFLCDGRGRPLLGESGPVMLGRRHRIGIGVDGSITCASQRQSGDSVESVDRLLLANPDPADLIRTEDGLTRRRDGAEAVVDKSVHLLAGFLENCDGDPHRAMERMIQLRRAFPQSRRVQIAKEHDGGGGPGPFDLEK